MGTWQQPDEEPDEAMAMAGFDGWTVAEPADDDLPTVDEVAEELEAEREALGAGLVSVLDALGDVLARLDKLDERLDALGELAELRRHPGYSEVQVQAIAEDVLRRISDVRELG